MHKDKTTKRQNTGKRRRKNGKNSCYDDIDYTDLVFTFNGVNIICDINYDVYGKDDVKKIRQAVLKFSEKIVIDKTYVDTLDTKYEKTFISEEEWKSICGTVVTSAFGKKLTKREYAELIIAYRAIIICYIECCMYDMGWDISNMSFQIADNDFSVQYEVDTYREWRRYAGPWQDWPRD